MDTRSKEHRRHSWLWRRSFAIGLITLMTLFILNGAPEKDALAQQTTDVQQQSYPDPEFDRQLKEVRENYPLIFRAFSFLRELHTVCDLDEQCFRVVQDFCLQSGAPPRFCLETANRSCCKPLKLAPVFQ